MQATFKQGLLFRRVIEAFKDFVPEANFVCESNAITLQAMDTAHVALVSLKLNEFDSYECKTAFPMGVHISNLYKVLKCMDAEDQLSIGADPSESCFDLEIVRANRSAYFKLHLIDLDTDQLSIPEQTYDCNVKLTATEFKKICGDLSAFGETITLGGMDDGFTFTATGDTGEASITLKTPIEYCCEAEVFLTFPLRYLLGFTKATPLSDHVTLRMSSDSPLVVEYTFPEGHLKFYLSPKMED
jgi:proliferating cell nuclear antigen